jgi:pimeloyl-ACP methyl ester carboxylesterase
MKCTIALFFLLSSIILSNFACTGKKNSFPVPRADTKSESVISESRPFKLGSDTYEADFGTITVPENRSKANTRLIHIPFLRIHSHSQKTAEPMFCFSGGPGQSNMYLDWKSMWYLLSDHDLVAVGYRGVDGSTVLNCPEVSKVFNGADDPLSDESMKTIGRASSASAKRLMAQGIDLDGYTMLDVVEDNESVRRALSYERINLVSGSYGTRIAYLYGLKHPGSIWRSAMISVNPPGHFVWEPQIIDAQLRHYAELWSRDSIMALKSPDLYTSMRSVLVGMPRHWLFFPINPGKVKVVTFALLFQRKTAAMVFDAYVAAEHGDPSGLAIMSLAYDYIMPSMFVWGEMASKAVSADFDSTRDYCREMEPPNLPLGSPMSKLLWGPLSYGRWPTTQLPEEFRHARRSDVQTLLLSGSVDFSTPPEFATNELLPYLKNGKQVILSECGHVNDVLYVNPENTRLMLTSFYATGLANTSLNSYVPMDFRVSWGFPAIAKITLGAVALAGILLVLVIVLIVRRRRRSVASRIAVNKIR